MRDKHMIVTIISLVVVLSWFTFWTKPVDVKAAKIEEQVNVADGINYKDIRFSNGLTRQALRTLEINLTSPHTDVELGLPSRLNEVIRPTALAKSYSQGERQVVGAINGSFFWNRTPMNLVATNNRLIHAGEVYEGEKDKYVNEPIAFGVDANGKGIIDYFNLNLSYNHNGNTYDISSTNYVLPSNQTILYTSLNPSSTITTESAWTDVVVTTSEKVDLQFGQTVTGTVTAVKRKGTSGTSTIPENGFILSSPRVLTDVAIGDSITLTVDIDDKWKNSQFLLASGPQLVRNGQVALTMNATSSNAKNRAPRTAVAVNKAGTKVFFVTVDGRQIGYSNGMNLTEFAQHLVELGADRALNLDGGGSTTMALKYPNTSEIKVVNRPSDDGYERAVSTSLLAISTEPAPIFTDVSSLHWAYDSIKSYYEKKIISGFPDGTFRPDTAITREQAAIMFTKLFNLDTTNVPNPGFSDVKESDVYYKQIAAVADAGIFAGKGNNRFAKDDHLTRAEMAAIIQRAFNVSATGPNIFPDVKDGHWAAPAIRSITAAGIAGGYGDKTYRPENHVSRAEFTAFLNRAE